MTDDISYYPPGYIPAESPVSIDIAGSCTIDIAVANMLAFDREATGNTQTLLLDYALSLKVGSEPYSLNKRLEEGYVAAQREFKQAVETSSSTDGYKLEKEFAVLDWQKAVRDAANYRAAIIDELGKKAASGLRIDQFATDRSGEQCITLKSLDEWATKNYDISLLDSFAPLTVAPCATEGLERSGESENDLPPGASETKYNNLLISFALLVHAISKTKNNLEHGGNPNAQNIAILIEDLAKQKSQVKLPGQSANNIRKLIAVAERTLSEESR